MSEDTKSSARLVQLAVMVLFFHLANSILQEAVFHIPGFHHVIFLSFLQVACVTVFAFIDFRRGGTVRKTPLRVYFLLSVFATASSVLTNEAAHRINYPTQVIFKSSKLLFVMALRALVMHGHIPTRKEIVSALCIVVGLIVFTWATSSARTKPGGHEISGQDMVIGVVAVIVALSCDALLYIGEEKYCFGQFRSTNTEVILYCNVFAVGNSFAALVTSQQLAGALEFTAANPSLLFLVVLFSLCNFAGTTFLLQAVAEFGSSTAVVITSTRKMATVLLSFVFYPKPFGPLHAVGIAGVTYGIWLHDQARKTRKAEQAATLEPAQQV